MSQDEDDPFWSSSDVKPFSFDDEATAATVGNSESSSSSGIKTLGSILAARPSSDAFLRPSLIKCGGHKIEDLISYIDQKALKETGPTPELSKQEPNSYISDIVNQRAAIDFSPYKFKREKLLLLDSAIACSDGNAIIAVTIFMSKTLKDSIFREELERRPIAMHHWKHYLEMTGRA